MEYIGLVWNVEHTDEFAEWWSEADEALQEDVTATVLLLMEHGPKLPFPHSSNIEGSRHGQLRELRVQSNGRPIRVFYASIHAVRPSFSLVETKRATCVFTRR